MAARTHLPPHGRRAPNPLLLSAATNDVSRILTTGSAIVWICMTASQPSTGPCCCSDPDHGSCASTAPGAASTIGSNRHRPPARPHPLDPAATAPYDHYQSSSARDLAAHYRGSLPSRRRMTQVQHHSLHRRRR